MLKKYTSDLSYIFPYAKIPPDVTYEEQPAEIMARKFRMFHNKETSMAKALWERHSEEEATWELELEMYERYHHLF